MKKLPKFIFSCLIALVLSLNLSSCKKEEEHKSVSDALESQNSKEITFEGVVYYQNDTDLYLGSSDSYIRVNRIKDSETTFKNGDKVSVTGYLSFYQSKMQIVGTTSISVVSENNQTLSSVYTNLYEILETQSTESKMYSKLIEIKGKLVKDSANYYLVDLFGNKIELNKGDDNLLNKIVKLNVVITNYSDSWCVEVASDFVEEDYTLAQIGVLAVKDLEGRVPENLYNKYTKPKSNLAGVSYTFSFRTNTSLNETFKQVSKSTSDIIELKVSYNSQTSGIIEEYNVNLWNTDAIDVSTLLNNKPIDEKTCVKIKGVVSSVLFNSSSTYETLIIKDTNTNDTIAVTKYIGTETDALAQKMKTVKAGENVVIRGTYNYTHESYDFSNCIYLTTGTSATSGNITVNQTTDKYQVSKDSAIVLDSYKTYSLVAANYEEYLGKLIKFSNPYLSYSGSSGTDCSWVVPLYTQDETAIYQTKLIENEDDEEPTRKIFGMSIAANDIAYGDSSWRTAFNIPSKNYNFERIGANFYGYLIPVPVSSGYLQFVLTSYDGFEYDDAKKIENSIVTSVNKNYYKSSDLELKNTINGVNITWESNEPDLINISSKKVELSESPKTVKLTAKYTYNNEECSLVIPVYLAGSKTTSVKDCLNQENNSTVFSKGVIIGYGSETLSSTYSSGTYRGHKGLLVKDLTTGDIVFVEYVEFLLETLYPNYEHQYNEYLYKDEVEIHDEETSYTFFSVDSHDLVIGTVIEFSGVLDKDNKSVNVRNGSIKWISDNYNYDYNDSDIVVVSSQDELSEAVYKINEDYSRSVNYCKVIKLVGTDENPIIFTPTSSKEASTNKMNFRIHFRNDISNSNKTMYDGYSLVLKQDNQYANTLDVDGNYPETFNELWYKKLGLPEIGVSGSLYPGYGFVGEMYIVITYLSSSSDGINCFYYSSSIVNYKNWNLTLVSVPDGIERDNE